MVDIKLRAHRLERVRDNGRDDVAVTLVHALIAENVDDTSRDRIETLLQSIVVRKQDGRVLQVYRPRRNAAEEGRQRSRSCILALESQLREFERVYSTVSDVSGRLLDR